MKDIPLYNLKENIKDLNLILAHLNENKEDETLYQHSNKTIDYFYKINEIKGIEVALDNIINRVVVRGRHLDKKGTYLFKELFVNAIYLHDIGKINPAFQKIKMKNKNIDSSVSNSEHSLISALIYIDIFSKKVEEISDKKIKRFMEYLMYLNAYCIAKHHSYLKNIDSFLSDLETLQKRVVKKPEYIKYYLGSSNIENLNFSQDKNRFASRNRIQKKEDYSYIEIYIFMKLLYSCIVSSDFYATYDYMNSEIDDFGIINDVDVLINQYKNTDLYTSIENYKSYKMGKVTDNPYKDIPINRLRTEMFLEAEKNLIENIDSNIFYLEAPTGGGKTNISINLALKIIKEKKEFNKVFYIFPFNSLIEQTKESLDNLFNEMEGGRGVAVVNSITPIITYEEKMEGEVLGSIDYEKHLLNRQFMHYPIVLTSHINFFNYLFGIGKEVNFPFIHLCNSVIIIDEIQSYRNDIWKEITIFFDKYAKILNMKIIIMSATLPKLDRLIGEDKDSNFIELIKDKEKYYNNKFFKDRVKLNFDMLKMKDITIDDIVEFVDVIWKQKQEARILIEFITKKDARNFFNKIVEKNPNKLIVELTGDDNKLTRKRMLNHLKCKKNGEYVLKDVLIVSTQVIEAGVDIDMDIGFKDISILDSEEQFLGRINRSCIGKGEAYFFNLTNPKLIYRNDHRTEMSLLSDEYRKFLETKNFEKFYFDCFESIEESKSQLNQNNIENFINDLRYLNFDDVYKKMELIQDGNYQVYLASKIHDGDNEINGKTIWQDYISLIEDKDMGYAEKKIKLSYIYEKMDYFLYNVNRKPRIEKQIIGNIYYIENGEDFMTNGKFDREKFKEAEEGLFL